MIIKDQKNIRLKKKTEKKQTKHHTGWPVYIHVLTSVVGVEIVKLSMIKYC
jgi:hypothetical protein